MRPAPEASPEAFGGVSGEASGDAPGDACGDAFGEASAQASDRHPFLASCKSRCAAGWAELMACVPDVGL